MIERGKRVAKLLAGAWRRDPSSLKLSNDQLDRIAPLLTYGGEAALAWARLRGGRPRNCPAVRWFREEHRRNSTTAFQNEEQIQYAITRLRAGGVEPILIKGWATARHYAEAALRPYSDLDLCVAPEQHSAASDLVRNLGEMPLAVDLHRGVPDLADRSWNELFHHSQLLELGGVPIRVLGPEDHLRLLCLHLVRHGGWRILWMCDVGASLEAMPEGFDWDYCLSGRRRDAEWVLCTVGLAGRLLEARGQPPVAVEVPSWLMDTTLWLWGSGHIRQSCRYYLRHLVEGVQGLQSDWLNPIKATYRLGLGPRHRWPLPLVQLGEWLRRSRELPKRFRNYGRKCRGLFPF